jgi:hypothetical protein
MGKILIYQKKSTESKRKTFDKAGWKEEVLFDGINDGKFLNKFVFNNIFQRQC